MCNFPIIDYPEDVKSLYASEGIQGLPESPQKMINILKKKKLIDDQLLSGINNMDALEERIINKIRKYSDNEKDLRDIFCLIHIWGGISGRNVFVMHGGLKWEKLYPLYDKFAKDCQSIKIEINSNRKDIINFIDRVYSMISNFYNYDIIQNRGIKINANDKAVHDIGISFLTKHTMFWLIRNNPENPLPIYDSTLACGLMCNPKVEWDDLKRYWMCMIYKARQENVCLRALERTLYNYYSKRRDEIRKERDKINTK